MKRIQLIIITFILLLPNLKAQINAAITIDKNDSTYCLGDTVFFTNTSTGNYLTSHWYFGDNTDTWTQDPFHIYLNPGTFTVTLIIADTSTTDTATITLTINPSPSIDLINNTDNQTLTASVRDTGISFAWYFNETLASNTDSTLYYYETGWYAVVATNTFHCSDSEAIYIEVNNYSTTSTDNLTIDVANNILTPNNDGSNDVLFINNLSSYSNACQVLIYNSYGMLVYRNDNYSNANGFQGLDSKGRTLPAGTYYYVIKSQGRKTATGFIDLIR